MDLDLPGMPYGFVRIFFPKSFVCVSGPEEYLKKIKNCVVKLFFFALPPNFFKFVCVLGLHEHKHILVCGMPQGLQALVSSYLWIGHASILSPVE